MSNRRARRRVYRQWLKLNKVPRPIFKKISEKLLFQKLNFQTFIEDLNRQIEANKEETAKATERAVL